MNSLPIDVIKKIIASCDHNARIILRGVNKTFYGLIEPKIYRPYEDIPHELFIDMVENAPWHLNADFFYEVLQTENVANIMWLLDNDCPCNENIFAYIASYYDFDLMERFYAAGCPWDGRVFEIIARCPGDTTDIMEWLREKNCPWSPNLLNEAARGHLNNMKWLYHNGILGWNEYTFHIAVYNDMNNIEKIIWMHENGCPWDFHVLITAAARGNLDLMNWLKDRNCPCTPEIVKRSARIINYSKPVLDWFYWYGFLSQD